MRAGTLSFTVITPVYNCEKYIEETINSVLKYGSKFDCEYIVVNDGSTDGTTEILAKFKNQIKIYNKENEGESEAVNYGLSRSNGDLVLVVSADDPLVSEYLFDYALELFQENENLVALYPDWQMIDENNNVIRINKVPEFSLEKLVAQNQVLPGPGTIFRKDAALAVMGRRKRWVYVGDYDFWLRLSDLGEFKRLPYTLAQWRQHSQSTSIRDRGIDMAIERIEVIKSYLNETGANLNNSMKRMAISNSYILASRLVFFDSRVPAKKYLFLAFWYARRWPTRLALAEFVYILFSPISKYLTKILGIIPKS